MKIYIVLIWSHNAGATTRPFADKDKAIQWAKDRAMEYCRWEEDFKEHDVDGWLYHATYCCEGDYVRVTEHKLLEE